VPVARPLAAAADPRANVYTERTYRPLPESGIRLFMQWIHSEQWDTVPTTGSPTEQVGAYEKAVRDKVEAIFPEKKVKTTNKDKDFITAELKSLDRKKKKEWKKNGKSTKYLNLKKEFEEKYKSASADHLKKNVTALKRDPLGRRPPP
jgi:hypothetical protein